MVRDNGHGEPAFGKTADAPKDVRLFTIAKQVVSGIRYSREPLGVPVFCSFIAVL